MDARDLWNEWVEPFDLFVSYARADNQPPHEMVTALVEAVEADFARFATDPPLKVFFDKRAILDGQHWEQVLQKGVRHLSVSYGKLGDVSVAGGNLRAARRYYERDLEIAERLAGADPGSADKQRDVGVSHFKLFRRAAQEDDTPAAVAHLRACVAVMGRLEAEGRLPNPNDQNALRGLRQQLEAWDAGASG